MKKIALLINPIAGIGGRAAFKGSDDRELVQKALLRGYSSNAAARAAQALTALKAEADFTLLTPPGVMGADAAALAGLAVQQVGEVNEPTAARDSKRLALQLRQADAELLLFVGGDGTARDVVAAVGDDYPVIGVPAGVKMHSAVFAVDPRCAGRLAAHFLAGDCTLALREVMDIDEEALKQGRMSARLYAYALTPLYEDLLQGKKTSGIKWEAAALQAVALSVREEMDDQSVYLIGPGTTTAAVMAALGLKASLLGVDAVQGGRLLGTDLNEQDLLALAQKSPCKIIVTPIGGQGYIFGRGNQQLSPAVIRLVGRQNISVIATEDKLLSLPARALRLDTGDAALDDTLGGYLPVVTGYRTSAICKVR